MLGKYDLECPICYVMNKIQLNKTTGVLKCKDCGSIFIDMNIRIEEGKVLEVILEPIGDMLYE